VMRQGRLWPRNQGVKTIREETEVERKRGRPMRIQSERKPRISWPKTEVRLTRGGGAWRLWVGNRERCRTSSTLEVSA
jgi:hypothetical protein